MLISFHFKLIMQFILLAKAKAKATAKYILWANERTNASRERWMNVDW